MSLKLHIDCGSTDGIFNLLKLLVRNTSCEPWVDCENTQDSIESILKRLVVETDDGSLALSVCGCSTSDLDTFDAGALSGVFPTLAEITAAAGEPSSHPNGYSAILSCTITGVPAYYIITVMDDLWLYIKYNEAV